jgi:predicted NAD/FAD-dependent oxidoreductase
LEDEPDEVSERLLAAVKRQRPNLGSPSISMVHRWRYARVLETAPGDFGLDLDQGLATCGDWHMGPRVEAAWLSGHRLGHAIADAVG